MILRVVTYILACDGCGYEFHDGKKFESKGGLLDLALSFGWKAEGDRHLCEECARKERS